jgi:hypothetical protein
LPYFFAVAKRITDVVLPGLPDEVEASVLKKIQALGSSDPKADGSEPIEGVANGYRVRCHDKSIEILYIVDDNYRHVWVFGVYIVVQ